MIRRLKNILERKKISKEKLKNRNKELEEMVIQKFGDDRQKQDEERQHGEEYKARRNKGEHYKDIIGNKNRQGTRMNEGRRINNE